MVSLTEVEREPRDIPLNPFVDPERAKNVVASLRRLEGTRTISNAHVVVQQVSNGEEDPNSSSVYQLQVNGPTEPHDAAFARGSLAFHARTVLERERIAFLYHRGGGASEFLLTTFEMMRVGAGEERVKKVRLAIASPIENTDLATVHIGGEEVKVTRDSREPYFQFFVSSTESVKISIPLPQFPATTTTK